MAELEYVHARYPSGDNQRTTTREQFLARLWNFEDKSRIRTKWSGEDGWGRWREAGPAVRRIRQITGRMGVGPKLVIQRESDLECISVRKVTPPLSIIDTNGNLKADTWWSAVNAEFAEYHPRFAGAYVCKSIAGSGGTPSQHSYGNAVDIFFDTFQDQERVAAWAVAHADEFSLEHVISGDRIWTRGVGWHAYTGDYHAHLHVDFNPQFSGRCGVKG